MQLSIREAVAGDVDAINTIANWYIEHTAVNFDVEAWSREKRALWLSEFNQAEHGYHLLVGELEGQVAGFCCNTRFRPKAAYDRATETTVYLAGDAHVPGAGSALYAALFSKLSAHDFHRAYAVITLPNARSIALHEKFGFHAVGTFNEIGFKFGHFHSVAIHEKPLGAG